MTNEIANSIRRRGRPTVFDRDEALQTAMGLFWRQGYAGTSTAQLANAIGITPPSLYHAFGSKEGLLQSCLDLYRTTIGAAPVRALLAAADCRSGMIAFLNEAADQFAENANAPGCFIALGEVQSAGDTPEISSRFLGLRLQAKETIEAHLQRGLVAGELPVGTDLEVLSAYFASVIQGLAVQAHDGARHETLSAIARLAMAVWPKSPEVTLGRALNGHSATAG